VAVERTSVTGGRPGLIPGQQPIARP
jgi:hypothetical protein